MNDKLVLVCGKSTTGKSSSLMNLDNPEGVIYLNCEAGKKLPFRSEFKEIIITDPLKVESIFEQAESIEACHTIVVDSLNYLMDMFESQYVLTAQDTRSAWSEYSQYFKRLMQHHVARSTKNVVFLAHTKDELNETEMVRETTVPIKGALKNQGIESYFSTVVGTKKVSVDDLDDYQNDLLNITPQEEALGFKHVYQTLLTKETRNERIRAPMQMWDQQETFIDNDLQAVFNRLNSFYN